LKFNGQVANSLPQYMQSLCSRSKTKGQSGLTGTKPGSLRSNKSQKAAPVLLNLDEDYNDDNDGYGDGKDPGSILQN
jgi:hypothetical protein